MELLIIGVKGVRHLSLEKTPGFIIKIEFMEEFVNDKNYGS